MLVFLAVVLRLKLRVHLGGTIGPAAQESKVFSQATDVSVQDPIYCVASGAFQLVARAGGSVSKGIASDGPPASLGVPDVQDHLLEFILTGVDGQKPLQALCPGGNKDGGKYLQTAIF